MLVLGWGLRDMGIGRGVGWRCDGDGDGIRCLGGGKRGRGFGDGRVRDFWLLG